jgi:hypothetical protein
MSSDLKQRREKPEKDFWWVDNLILTEHARKVGGEAFVTYCFLAMVAWRDPVSVYTLLKACGASKSALWRHLGTLQEHGLIKLDSGFISLVEVVEKHPVEVAENAVPEVGQSQKWDSSRPTSGTDCPRSGTANKEEKKRSKPKNVSLFGDPVKDPDQWKTLIAEIDRLYREATGVTCPWTTRAFAQLSKAVAANTAWGTEEWLSCIRNRFVSDDANPADPPERFVSLLSRYVAGPLDRFHLSKQRGNHEVKQTASPRTTRNREAAERVKNRIIERERTTQNQNPRDVDGDSRSHGD